MIPPETHLQIGSLLFEGLNQIDRTGPFEVLSRIPNSTHRRDGKTVEAVRDVNGLRLTPDAALADAPQLDVLHVPGGFGRRATTHWASFHLLPYFGSMVDRSWVFAAGVTAGIDIPAERSNSRVNIANATRFYPPETLP